MTDVNEANSNITIPNQNRSFCFNHVESQESSEKDEALNLEEALKEQDSASKGKI